MPVIKAQKIPQKRINPEDLLASFCYYFPQYTFAHARKLPYKRVVQMLKVANKEYARAMIDLTLIVAAPHSKGDQVKKLFDRFSAIINE